MIYFISGHRDITEEEFEKYYIPAIYSAYHNQDFEGFVVGDYEGVDKTAMDFITENLPCGVVIYHIVQETLLKMNQELATWAITKLMKSVMLQ